MNIDKLVKNRLGILILVSLLSVVFNTQAAKADEVIDFRSFKPVKKMPFGSNIKARGLQLSKQVYIGRIKTAGKYRPGVIVDRKTYAWSINNRGISIHKRF